MWTSMKFSSEVPTSVSWSLSSGSLSAAMWLKRENAAAFLASFVLSMVVLFDFSMLVFHPTSISMQQADRIQVLSEPEYSSPLESFLLELKERGTEACHGANTSTALLFGIPTPEEGSEITLSTGIVHEFILISYDENGTRRCHGGDFFETDLTGAKWRSRPPVTDLGSGSYKVELFVDDAFPGTYTFKAILMYTNFHGMDSDVENWTIEKEVLNVKFVFVSGPQSSAKVIPSCLKDGFITEKWKGRWTRTKMNESCVRTDFTTRYRCFAEDESCDPPWCDGHLGRLDSNGWVYSAHCAFHLWTANETWNCLKGKRLFFWGDSNHLDTSTNLLNLVLDLNHQPIQRYHDETVVDGADPSRSFRLTNLFNGHSVLDGNGLGLASLYDAEYRSKVERLFQEGGAPDILVMNSGLHDGMNPWKAEDFIAAVKNASQFWGSLTKSMKMPSKVIFRNTVTPAGQARHYRANPHKMEVFNQILVKELLKEIDQLKLVDAYDMTFPWHYDNTYSDGGHYGRMPLFYFVDVMLLHVLLNAICQ